MWPGGRRTRLLVQHRGRMCPLWMDTAPVVVPHRVSTGDAVGCPMNKPARNISERRMLDKLNREREQAGVCRHCGGPVPCWSPFGDVKVGVRRKR